MARARKFIDTARRHSMPIASHTKAAEQCASAAAAQNGAAEMHGKGDHAAGLQKSGKAQGCCDAAQKSQNVTVDEALWASSIMPEGTVVRWLIADRSVATAGHPIVEVRIEDALHEIMAPASGRPTIVAAASSVVGPGSLLATLDVAEPLPHG
jgi:hypothetical protein